MDWIKFRLTLVVNVIITFTLCAAVEEERCSYTRDGDKQYFYLGYCIEIITNKVEHEVLIQKTCSSKPECRRITEAAGCVNGTQSIKQGRLSQTSSTNKTSSTSSAALHDPTRASADSNVTSSKASESIAKHFLLGERKILFLSSCISTNKSNLTK